MTRLLALFAAPWFCLAALAQVDVDLVFDRAFFLPGEPLETGVRIANFSGQPLTLGQDPRWLQFTVEGARNQVVAKLEEPHESGEFTLKQATRGTLRWNLTPLFAIDDPGVYRVFATVRLPTGEVVTSSPATFEIVTGVALNEPREVGVKLPDGSIERRKFVLQQVNFLDKVQMYLRITDPKESRTYAVAPLGRTVSFDRPQWVVDRETRFHILHRVSGTHYAYHVFQGDGTLTLRQVWSRKDQGRLELRVNDEGEVRVMGGVRQVVASDIPAPSTTNSVAPLKEGPAGPAGTLAPAPSDLAPAINPREAKTNDVPAPPP